MRWLLLATMCLVPTIASGHELGLCIHLDAGVGVNATKDAGLKWVRIDMNWDIAQPNDAAPDFTVMDQVVDAATAKGLSVLAVIGYTPAWASSGNMDAGAALNDIPVAGKYEAFVTLAVNHFKNRVTYFELWNEPNLTQFFEGTPQQYIDLVLKPGADAVRAACPTCKVVSGGLASLSAGKYDVWLDAILKQAKDKIDVVNGHVYADFTEDNSGAGVTSDSFLNRLESHRVIAFGGVTFYEGPKSFKEVMDANAVTKPFWLTETGMEAPLGDAAKLDRQKRFYRRVLEKATTRPWWTTTIFYEGFDTMSPMYTFGIVQDAGAGTYIKKPVFDFLKQAVTGASFGGTAPACSDFLDNDGDGLIDFPDDTDCFDPTGTTEGVPVTMDLAGLGLDANFATDGGTNGYDAGSMGTTPIGGGQSPKNEDCSFGGQGTAAEALGLLVLAALAFVVARRRA